MFIIDGDGHCTRTPARGLVRIVVRSLDGVHHPEQDEAQCTQPPMAPVARLARHWESLRRIPLADAAAKSSHGERVDDPLAASDRLLAREWARGRRHQRERRCRLVHTHRQGSSHLATPQSPLHLTPQSHLNTPHPPPPITSSSPFTATSHRRPSLSSPPVSACSSSTLPSLYPRRSPSSRLYAASRSHPSPSSPSHGRPSQPRCSPTLPLRCATSSRARVC